MSTLSPGTQLGSYEILALLGAGGMGEVYRARDGKLRREVAIKVLPGVFTSDADRVARFHREALAIAALNHPNIAAIYGLEESSATTFLVLELVEGETLAERMARGRLPIEEVLNFAKQITEALEAAHEKGVIHRDLKPANIKITPDGKVKVLDFGLAKALDNTAASENLSQSPTLSIAGTQAGMILGTAAYMSPEQAKGFNTDHRSDIFSFGSLLYEMLAGRRAFDGDSISDVLASVLKTEPDLALLPKNLNPRLVELLRRCLTKNPKARWHAAADIRVEIEAITAHTEGLLIDPSRATVSKPLWKRAAPAVLCLILGGFIAGVAVWFMKAPASSAVSRFAVLLPDGQNFSGADNHVVAISPDGTQLVYVANSQLYLRSLAELEPRAIPGTNLGGTLRDPVFSPDGHWLAFWTSTDSTIKRIATTGGAPITIAATGFPLGMSWDGKEIVFDHASEGTNQVMRVPASGGTPEAIATINPSVGRSPQILPGGKAVLYSVGSLNQWDKGEIVVQILKSGERKTVISGGSDARYLPTGHIVYGLAGTLFAQPFDIQNLTTTGPAVPVVEGVRRSSLSGAAQFSISNNGGLVYIPGPISTASGSLALVTMDRSGDIKPLGLPPGNYWFPRISHDGNRVAFGVEDGKEANIWIYDLSGKSPMRRLTFGGSNRYPIWSWNDESIAFQSDREGDAAIFWQKSDFTGTAERLTKPEKDGAHIPDSWSPDGQRFSYTAVTGTAGSVWIFSLQDKKATLFADAPSAFLGRSVISPDGRWIAFQSNQSGAAGVYVQPFLAKEGTRNLVAKRTLNTPHHPQWSKDGKELFYVQGPGQFAVVSVTLKPAFTFGNPSPLPGILQENGAGAVRSYDVTPDGKGFIGTVSSELGQGNTASVPRMVVVLNWLQDVKQRMATLK